MNQLSAEMISFTYFQCVLKGLQRAPLITTQLEDTEIEDTETLSAADVHAIIIPKGCFGLPVYAALHQNIPVIAVADTIYAEDQTDLVRSLPWQNHQYQEVATYTEAIGVLACLKAGLTLESVSRPLDTMRVNKTMPATVVTKHRTTQD